MHACNSFWRSTNDMKIIAWKSCKFLSTVITVLPLKVHVILKIRKLDDENWIISVPYDKHCCSDQNRFCSHICSCRKFNLEGIGVCKTFCTTSSPCLGNFSNNFSSRTFDLKLILSKLLNLKLKKLWGSVLGIAHLHHNCTEYKVRICHRFSGHFYPTLPSASLCNKLALLEFCLVLGLDGKLLATKITNYQEYR